MKKFIYALTLCIAAGMTSCKDDDSVYSPSDLDRMPRTMFRSENTTNVRPENDEYSSNSYRAPATLSSSTGMASAVRQAMRSAMLKTSLPVLLKTGAIPQKL